MSWKESTENFADLPGIWLGRLGHLRGIAALIAQADEVTDWRRNGIQAHLAFGSDEAKASFISDLEATFDSRLAVSIKRLRSEAKILGLNTKAGFSLTDEPMLYASMAARKRPLLPDAFDGSVSTGTYCSLDDMWATAVCNPDFLFERGDEEPRPAPTVILGAFSENRFLDYSKALQGRADDFLGAFTKCLPLCPARIALAITLSELSADWIVAHEASHEMLGHFKYMTARGLNVISFADGPQGPDLKYVGGVPRLPQLDAHALEIQADWLATVMLVSRLARPGAIDAYPLYMLNQFRLRNDREWAAPALDDVYNRFRITIVAAMGAAMILEMRPAKPSMSHPLPSLRVLSLLAAASDLFELIVLDANPGLAPSEVHDNLNRILIEAAKDMDLLSRETEMASGTYRISGPKDLKPGRNKLVADALLLTSKKKGAGAFLRTKAGKAYGGLRRRSLEIWSELDRRRLGKLKDIVPFSDH